MQPAQLSLLPEQTPTPPEMMLSHLPAPVVTEAIAELARLVAAAAQIAPVEEEAANE